MANYYGVTRTNYVRLKDDLAYEQFKQVVKLMSGTTEERIIDGVRIIAAFGNDDSGDFCAMVDMEDLLESGYQSRHVDSELNAKNGEYLADQDGMCEIDTLDNDQDLLYELYPLLAEDEVLVLQSAGSENQRYVCGYSEAINQTGERISVNIDDIYKKAKLAFQLDKEPSSASY